MTDKEINVGNGIVTDVTPEDLNEMESEVELHFGKILTALRIDWQNDHNMAETPYRWAKMMVHELLRGRFTTPPKITSFENIRNYDQLITVGPIEVKTMCSHHMLPFHGVAFVGLLPGENSRLPGLSKYARIITEYFSRRLQIQEEFVDQIVDFFNVNCKPRGVGVRVSAQHMCAGCRGVNQMNMRMGNVALRGEMLTDTSLKQEFLDECDRLWREVNR